MCGIAGFIQHTPAADARSTIARMAATLRHRGPDDKGMYVDDAAALGVRRLSVIDLATGRQPIANEDRTVWVVHNGEIYNHADLRSRLADLGHVFRTRSDAEVLVHAYEEYGIDCVARLDGMFAFAVWDARQRRLLLARDRMGEKPLYYHAGAEAFVFGSELRALLPHPAVPHRLDLHSLVRYLTFEYVPTPHAMLEGIAKLPPGHLLTVRPCGKPHLSRYWNLDLSPDSERDPQEWCALLREQLNASVRRQLVSDVPVGFLLSGGVDSSAVVAAARRLVPNGTLKTFSVGFAEATYDERPFAREVAAFCGTEHTEIEFGAADVADLLERVGELFDEPLVDRSFLPFYRLSEVARRSVTVVLSGDGGDELFCGYPTFLADRAAMWMHRAPRVVQTGLARVVNQWPLSARYGSVESLVKRFFRALPYQREIRTQLLLGGLLPAETATLLAPRVRAATSALDPYQELTESVAEVPDLSPMDRLIYQHCKFYLADQNIVTVDRASMACGLEVRAPFLDRPLVELANRIPAALKLRGWESKHILKRALRGSVPDQILRRRKQGFGVPLGAWLRGPLRDVLHERLAPEAIARLGLFDAQAVARLVTEHLSSRHDRQKILWALLMFDAWRERYLPGARWT